MKTLPKITIATSLALLMAGTGGIAAAQTPMPATRTDNPAPGRDRQKLNEAFTHVNKAVQVVRQMEGDRNLAALLNKSRGVFVVPDYGRAALGIGGSGGAGVLMTRHGGTWSAPAFYNMGGISAGLQAGVEAGAIAFVLNDQKALDAFMQGNKFSLNADAGLTLVNWSRQGMGSAGMGNITVWSDTEGLFGGAALNITDVDYDEDETGAYYNRAVSPRDIVAGKVNNPHAAALQKALAATTSGTGAAAVGSSGTRGTTGTGTTRPERER